MRDRFRLSANRVLNNVVLNRVYILGIFCPKQGQTLSGSPIPKYWSSNPPPQGLSHGESISGKLPNFEITIVWHAEFQDSACRILKFQDLT